MTKNYKFIENNIAKSVYMFHATTNSIEMIIDNDPKHLLIEKDLSSIKIHIIIFVYIHGKTFYNEELNYESCKRRMNSFEHYEMINQTLHLYFCLFGWVHEQFQDWLCYYWVWYYLCSDMDNLKVNIMLHYY